MTSQPDFSRIYTTADYDRLPDDGNRYELIDGRLIEIPPLGDEHGSICDKLYCSLVFFDPQSQLGSVWVNTGFVLDTNNTPEPDLMFVVANRRPPKSKKALAIIPDLVVEIWSPSQITKQGIDDASKEKIRKYREAGVKIIWSINPDNKTVSVYHPDQADPVRVLTVNDVLNGENIITNFTMPVAKLFE
jgi:Uma2 family endonuclease